MVTPKLSIINYQFLKRAQRISIFLILIMNSFSFNSQVILNWEIKHARTNKWIHLGDKGSVQEALINSGELPDPFYGKNEELFTWVEDYCWEFRSEFKWDKKKNEKVLLTFPNVDTYAKIYLNEVLIAETNNAFVHYNFLIQENLKDGKNVLSVVFDSPTRYQQKHKSEVGVNLPAPNDVGKEKIASYCRKPQYQFGWDWALRMVTMGFWKPVTVESIPFNKVLSYNSQTLSIEPEKSQQFEVTFLEKINGTISWESKRFGTKKLTINGNSITRTESVNDLNFWWPRGHGDQNLYEDEWIFKNEAGELIATKNIRFGVRKTELIQESDKWGTSYEVKINGKVIFCKGGDYIPDDIFPARITNEKLQSNVETMIESNFNMVRIWGGGMYASDYFLNLCDEKGLMVWHDFMFACAMYPGNESYLSNVKNEINQQIPRITSHPAVVLLNGNNEVDVAWKNWGFQTTYSISKSDQKIIEEYYKKLFLELIPTQVSAFSTVPYVHTSPLSNWGKDEYYNHGSQHYWGVWHGKDPMSDFAVKSGRFNAEYGFQSFPEYATLLGFSKETDWSLDNPIMKHHQKSYVGNGMIKKHSDILFGETRDFKRFVYLSQLTQAKAVSTAIVSHRAQFPKVSGTLYWQVNDCWPAPSWSSIDYNLNWKALQYQVKKDFADVTIAQLTNADQSQQFVLLTDDINAKSFKVQMKLYSSNGNLIKESNSQFLAFPAKKAILFEEEIKGIKEQDVLIEFYCIYYQNDSDIQHAFSNTFVINDSKKESKAELIIKGIKQADNEYFTLTFEVKNHLVKDLWFYSNAKNVHFDENFETYLPGIHTIIFQSKDTINLSDIEFQFR